jgi:phenylacetate-CoA ligase
LSRSHLYATFLRRVALPVIGQLQGMPVSAALRELERSQWWQPEALAALQLAKLRRLADHAYAQAPLYRRLWDAHGVHPQDIRSLNDLARLPLLDKPTLRAAYPDDALAANIDRGRLVRYASSGSTGEPLQFVMTRAEKGQRWAVMFRSWAMAGAYQGMRAANVKDGHALGVFHSGPLQRLEQQATRMLNLSAYAVHDQRLDQVVRDLVRFRPEVMFAYPGTAYRLAVALAERGIDLPLHAVITSGEMLHPFQRQAIEQQFRCRVHDYYGGEGMDVAIQCGAGSTYHINAESVIVEVVDADGRPLPAGREGSIVLTNLNAYAMPFIRYVVGDVGALAAGQCACGRGLPLLDHVAGRSSDQLTLPSGRGLVMWFFTDVFRQMPGVESFQMRQVAADRILVLVAPGPAFGHLPAGAGQRAAGGPHELGAFVGPDAALQFLRQRLEEQVRGEAALDLALVETIPLGPGGKHRFFVSDVAP